MRLCAPPVRVALLVAIAVCAGVSRPLARDSQQLTSRWRDREIRVDGVDEDWRDATAPVKGQHFAIGFANDSNDLYFCLVTKDAVTVRQIANLGLTLWIDAPGARKRSFGLHFPVSSPSEMSRRRQVDPRESGDKGRTGARDIVIPGQEDIEVLGPGKKDARNVDITQPGALAARVGLHDDLLVYEMKVPLRRGEGAPFAVEADPGALLRVELQTAQWRGRPPVVGAPMIGIGISPGLGRGGMLYPGIDGAMLKPLDVAADLKLASEPR